VKTNGKGSVAVSRTGSTFVAGQVITLTATPAIGSGWFGWTGDAASAARTITVTMTKDMVVTANFK
jgi:Divergent InlB B-repeat domain